MEILKKKMGRETWVNQVSRNEEEVTIIRQRYAEFWKDKSDAMQKIQGFHIRANNHTRVGNVHFILMSEIIFSILWAFLKLFKWAFLIYIKKKKGYLDNKHEY